MHIRYIGLFVAETDRYTYVDGSHEAVLYVIQTAYPTLAHDPLKGRTASDTH